MSERLQFARPPVREVGLAVMFEPLTGLLASEAGDLLNVWRDRYPLIVERPAMPDWRIPPQIGIHFGISDDAPSLCWWARTVADDRLIRFQYDRVICS